MQKDLLEYMPELLELTKTARDQGLRMSVEYSDGYRKEKDLDLQGINIFISSIPIDNPYIERISKYSSERMEEVIDEIKEVLGVEG